MYRLYLIYLYTCIRQKYQLLANQFGGFMVKGVLLSVLILFQLSFCSGVYFYWKNRKQQISASSELSNQALNSDEDWTSKHQIRYLVK